MKQRLLKAVSCSFACLMLIMQPVVSAFAETITIGKGTGIIWEGLPFSATLSGSLDSTLFRKEYGLLAISSSPSVCMLSSNLKNIGGYMALPLPGVSGVGLIPRATGVASYVRRWGDQETLNGTIGLPETKASSSSGDTIYPPSNYVWCLPPQDNDSEEFYSADENRTATMAGSWLLVADGTQREGEATLPPIYFASYSALRSGDRNVTILPPDIKLRITMLECSVSTPTAINFGYVSRNTATGAELAFMPVQVAATCEQGSDRINANINLQFRAVSGLYNNEPSRLALNQGGGYITGEIDGGVTGSGSCGATTGLRFDNTAIKLGSITSAESSKVLANQLVWRLCSGGSSLPEGAVTASTEMMVTFN